MLPLTSEKFSEPNIIQIEKKKEVDREWNVVGVPVRCFLCLHQKPNVIASSHQGITVILWLK